MVLPGFPGGRVARRWDPLSKSPDWRSASRGSSRFQAHCNRVPLPQALRPTCRFECCLHLGKEGGPISLSISTCERLCVAALFILVFATGCAGSAWKQALRKDTAAGYHAFLREHPESEYATAAQERIAFQKLRSSPTLEAFESFREQYPESGLVEGLRGQLEEATFASALATGTPASYERFAEVFPDGEYAARARGNAVYLREISRRPNPDALRQFAIDHPASDFAIEAQRSADVTEVRRGQQIANVGLVVEVGPGVAEDRRVAQAFAGRALETYSLAGTRLVRLASSADAASAGVDALLVVHHAEEQRANVMAEGLLPQPGVLATTRVTLEHGDQTIFERDFILRTEAREHEAGKSVLFGSGGLRFWAGFFVPVASWEVHRAVRQPVELSGRAAAVDASGDRAVVMYDDGGFAVLQLANPAAPVKLAEYQRKARFERFDGVRVLSNRVAIFGDDGLELVGVAPDGSQTVLTRSRAEVGSVSALALLGDRLILGSGKGLLALPLGGEGEPERVLRRAVRGMGRAADLLVLADQDTLLVSSLPLLRQDRVIGQLKIGKSFATQRIRVFGTKALVIGDGGVMVVDLRSPANPRLIGRLRPDRVGRITDAGRAGGRIFLVGERGVQVLGSELDRVVEVVDAVPAGSIAAFGRHLVAVGGSRLQVIDGLPFGAGLAKPPVAKSR